MPNVTPMPGGVLVDTKYNDYADRMHRGALSSCLALLAVRIARPVVGAGRAVKASTAIENRRPAIETNETMRTTSGSETPAYEWASGGHRRGPPDALTVSRFLMLRVADVHAMWGRHICIASA